MMSLTVKVLKEMAKELGIKGYSKMDKETLAIEVEAAKLDKEINELEKDLGIDDETLKAEKEEVEMNKEVVKENVTLIDDGELGGSVKTMVDNIPTPINSGKPMTVANALMEALKHPAGTVIEVGTEEEIKAIEDSKEEVIVEDKKEELVKEEEKEVANVIVKAENIGAKDDKGYAPINDVYVQAVNTGACFGVIGIEPNGLFKLLNARGTNLWLREDILNREDKYRAVTKAVADKVMKESGAQSPAPNKENKVTYNNKDKVAETILAKAKAAGEHAKSKFEFRVEQLNSFRQMVLINNKTGEQIQVGVGATVAGRILELEYEASNGVKVNRENKVAENKQSYNPKVKYSKCHCVECINAGVEKDKARITEAEKKYLLDNQKYLPEELKNKPLCYKHQATTGARRAIIQGRHGDSSNAHTTLDSNTKSLLR